MLGVALVVVGAVLIANSPLSKVDAFARVPIREGVTNSTVHLTRTGSYVAYFETPTGGPTRYELDLALGDPSGQRVPLHLYSPHTALTYDVDNRRGRAVYTFKITKAGDYRVLLRSDVPSDGTHLAFGESVAHGLVAGVSTIVPGVLLIVAAIVLLIVGLVRRGRHKRELRDGYGYPPGGAGPPAPPGPSFTKQNQPGPGQGYPPQGAPGSGGYQGYPGYPPPGQNHPGR